MLFIKIHQYFFKNPRHFGYPYSNQNTYERDETRISTCQAEYKTELLAVLKYNMQGFVGFCKKLLYSGLK